MNYANLFFTIKYKLENNENLLRKDLHSMHIVSIFVPTRNPNAEVA